MTWVHALCRNAVTKKDFNTLVRLWRPIIGVTASVSILGTMAAAFLITQANDNTSAPEQVGGQLLGALAAMQLFVIILITPALYAASIGAERRRLTWDLLVMSRLPSLAIVWGKLVAGLAFNVLLILAALPLFAIAFPFGGVGLANLLQIYAVLLASIFLMGGIGLLVATLVRSLPASMVISSGLAIALAVGLSALILNVGDGSQVSLGAYAISPQLTRLAPLDPFAGLISAVPNGGGVAMIGRLASVQQPFGLSPAVPMWAAYSLLAIAGCCLLLVVAAALVRHPWRAHPAWPR